MTDDHPRLIASREARRRRAENKLRVLENREQLQADEDVIGDTTACTAYETKSDKGLFDALTNLIDTLRPIIRDMESRPNRKLRQDPPNSAYDIAFRWRMEKQRLRAAAELTANEKRLRTSFEDAVLWHAKAAITHNNFAGTIKRFHHLAGTITSIYHTNLDGSWIRVARAPADKLDAFMAAQKKDTSSDE